MYGRQISGRALRRARQRSRKTREDVGTAVHRSADSVARWEREETQPPEPVALKVAEFLGVDLSELEVDDLSHLEVGA